MAEANECDSQTLINNDESAAIMQIDQDLEAIKTRVREMEAEAEKINEMESEVNKQLALISASGAPIMLTFEEKQEIDNRSVYVGNVDYGASPEELHTHFHGCGTINRVTIPSNKADGHPKGFAYIEFGSQEYIETALLMNDTLFRGRQIKVMTKRTNHPGISTTNRFPRGSRGRSTRISRGRGHRGARIPYDYQVRDHYYNPY